MDGKSRIALILRQFDCRGRQFILQIIKWTEIHSGLLLDARLKNCCASEPVLRMTVQPKRI
jgi:hypothetical protein